MDSFVTPPHCPDPAAQFAIAHSLWQACHDHAAKQQGVNLSETFNGMDEFMRVVMQIGERFERWACEHVRFENLNDVWPYLLQDRFGDTCLELITLEGLADFTEEDCLRVSVLLRLPVFAANGLPVPIYLEVANPVIGSSFKTLRIQTFRRLVNDDVEEPFVFGDDPFDENFEAPFFSLYGIDADGSEECIADRPSYKSMRDLALKLAPEIGFPEQICVEY